MKYEYKNTTPVHYWFDPVNDAIFPMIAQEHHTNKVKIIIGDPDLEHEHKALTKAFEHAEGTTHFYKVTGIDTTAKTIDVWLKGTQQISEDEYEDWDDYITMTWEGEVI